MEIKNKLIKNTLFNFIVRLWNILLSFLLFPFIVIHIGKHAAAVWILLSSINAYFQIFDIAFSVSLIKYTSEFYAKKEFDKINEYINTSFIIFAVSGIVVFFCLLILKIFVNDLFHIPLELQEETGTVIMITAVFTLFIIPFSVFRNVIVGLQRFDITSHVDFYISSLQLIFTVFFLIKGFGLTSLIIINSSAAAISIIIFMIYVKKLLPSFRFLFRNLKKETVKDISQLSISMFIINISSFIINKTDQILIGIFLPIQNITFYSAGFKIYQGAGKIPLILLQAIMPASSELNALDQKAELKKIFFFSTRYTTALMTPVAITAIIFAKDILRLWMGTEFEPHSAVIQILVLNLFFLFLHQAGGQILVGLNKVKEIIPYYWIIMISNIVLSIILVHFIELKGIAWGTTIPFIFMEFFYLKYLFKQLEITWKEFFSNIIFKVYVPGIFILGINLAILHWFRFENIIILIGYFFLIGLVYLGVFYSAFLNRKEREEIKSILMLIRKL